MREIVPGENAPRRAELDAEALAQLRALRAAVSARSGLVWAEHCTECAYPACYAVCSEYTPRPDLHCRRFDRGIQGIRVDGIPDALMRIRFRKWGKLEAEGPARVVSRSAARLSERLRNAVAWLADREAALPFAMRRRLARAWLRAQGRLPGRAIEPDRSAFVIECVTAGRSPVAFTVSMLPRAREAGLFQERFVLAPGYARVVIPASRIASQIDLDRPFLVQIEPLEAEPAEAHLFGIVDFVTVRGGDLTALAASASRATPRVPASRAKCVVWDLDNTLWQGTLAEDGIEGLQLKLEVVEVIKALDARGILASVASKNDETEGLAALAHFGLSELFLHPQIGWGPKSESLRRIAQLLDIGLDALAFVDDQPFERSEVLETLGCVTVFDEPEIAGLTRHPLFDVPVTAESARRRSMYREEMDRKVAFDNAGASDYRSFLRSSNITLDLSILAPDDVTRVFELSQRTNQVNISGARYERAEVERLAASANGKLPIVMRCSDRFGDYGVIGFALLDVPTATVSDYFMSCRVQRKFVEHALFQQIVDLVAQSGAARLRVRYRRTERNRPALTFLRELGFELKEQQAGSGWLERGLEPIPGSDLVRIPTRLRLRASAAA